MNTSDSNLIRAFRILFEPGVFSPHFFRYLQLPEVRSAYRKRALLVHPDRVTTPDEELKKKYTEAFIEANRAYQQIMSFIEKRDGHFRSRAPEEKGRRPESVIKPSQGNDQDLRFYRGSLPRRPLFFGEFLYYSGLVPWKTLIEAIVWQRRQRPRFGEMARRWFKLSMEEIEWIMSERRPLERIGEYFVEKGHLTDERVKELLIYFERFNRPFGSWRFR